MSFWQFFGLLFVGLLFVSLPVVLLDEVLFGERRRKQELASRWYAATFDGR